jgi:formylglycine-generating enzyme required for sulfatase activity
MIEFVIVFLAFACPAYASGKMVLLPAGSYTPFILRSVSKKGDKPNFRADPVKLNAFLLDSSVVTNGQFLEFVKAHKQWSKSQVPAVFADAHYLNHWKSDFSLSNSHDKNRPVTQVSWFAANAYCESLGKILPTTDQWEYALADNGRNSKETKKKILAWYSQPNSSNLSDSGTTRPNGFGIYDMIGVVWEWTLDFNSFLVGDELRSKDDKDEAQFCGGGSLGTLSPDDYSAYMRYSFRASMKASYTTQNLGFRCAKETK